METTTVPAFQSYAGLSGITERCRWIKRKGAQLIAVQFLLLVCFQANAHLPWKVKAGKAMEKISQDIIIKGKVIDKTTGKPVAGATVTVKGVQRGTSTAEDGSFTLSVPTGKAVLIITSIGYTTMEQVISDASADVTVEIAPSLGSMNEVVVTALGIQRQAKSLTYATQKIGGEQINEVRDASFSNTLNGKVAGLTITPSANGPGGPSRILLRGNRSIQGVNNALIVVDGVPIDNSTPGGEIRNDAGDDNGGHSGSDGASSINPDDIESINVLKGASGAALYGSRAANGVIMITTKRGKPGKTAVNINSGASVESPMILQKLQNEYSQGAGGAYSTGAGTSFGAKISGQSVTDWQGNTVNLQAFSNNIKDFYKTGFSTNNAIGVSGGSEKVQTYFSYANNYVDGIVPTNQLVRNTFNARLGINITDKLSVDAKVTYMLQDIYNKPGVGGDGMVVANLYQIPRTVNLQDLKHYENTDANGIQTPTYWTSPGPVYMNPYWTIYNTHHEENRSRVTALVVAKYKITDWLNVQGRVSSDSYTDFIPQTYANNTANYARHPGGFYSEENDFISERNFDFLLSGVNNITRDFKVTYNVGASLSTRDYRIRQTIADGLNITNKFDLSFATSLRETTLTPRRDLQSVYGTAQFSFKNYLFLDVTGRNDWSSTLPSPYSYFYPSVGLTAVLSDMLRMPSFISFGKIRVSATQVGNDSDPYLINQTYGYSPGHYGGYISASSVKSIGNLKPELTKSFEVGTEWRFVNDRFGVDVTYYKTNSRNQLLQVGVPASSGYGSAYINAGNIQNSGIEVMLNAKVISSPGFNWDIGVNYALNSNKVIELTPTIKSAPLGSSVNIRTATPLVVVGGSYGDLYGYTWTKLNGQYVVNSAGLPVTSAVPEKVGNFNPNYVIGFSNTFSYHNWSFGVLIDGKFGGVVTSGTAGQMANAGTAAITTKYRDPASWVIPAVQADGTKNGVAVNAEQFWQTVSAGDYSWAQVFTYDATAVRVREVTLGYNFSHLPSFLKMARLSLVARNLFFIYRGSSILDIPGIGKRKIDFDPEVSFGNSNYQGIEYYSLPSTRSLGINLKLSF